VIYLWGCNNKREGECISLRGTRRDFVAKGAKSPREFTDRRASRGHKATRCSLPQGAQG